MNSEEDSAPGPSEPKNTDSSPQKRPAESSGESTESKRIKASVQNLRTRGSSEEPGPSELREYESERIKDKEELKKVMEALLKPDCRALDNPDLVRDMLNAAKSHNVVVNDTNGAGSNGRMINDMEVQPVGDPHAINLNIPSFLNNLLLDPNVFNAAIALLMYLPQLNGAQNAEEEEEEDVEEEHVEDEEEEVVNESGDFGEEDPIEEIEAEEQLARQEYKEVEVHFQQLTDYEVYQDARLNRRWYLLRVMTDLKFDYTKLAEHIKKMVEPADPSMRQCKIYAFVKNVLFGYTEQHYKAIMSNPVRMSLTTDGRKIFWRMVKFMLWDAERIEDSLFPTEKHRKASRKEAKKKPKRTYTLEENAVYDAVFAQNPDPTMKQIWLAALEANNGFDRAKVAFKTRRDGVAKKLREARAREHQAVHGEASGTSGV